MSDTLNLRGNNEPKRGRRKQAKTTKLNEMEETEDLMKNGEVVTPKKEKCFSMKANAPPPKKIKVEQDAAENVKLVEIVAEAVGNADPETANSVEAINNDEDEDEAFAKSRSCTQFKGRYLPGGSHYWRLSDFKYVSATIWKGTRFAVVRQYEIRGREMKALVQGLHMNSWLWSQFTNLIDRVDTAFQTPDWVDTMDEDRCDPAEVDQSEGPIWLMTDHRQFHDNTLVVCGIVMCNNTKCVILGKYCKSGLMFEPSEKIIILNLPEWEALKKLVPAVTEECTDDD